MIAGSSWRLDLPLAIIVTVAGLIALIAPFDVIFDAVSARSAVLRAAIIAALAVVGAACARSLGLRLEAHGPGQGLRHPLAIGVTAAAGVAVYVLLLDLVLFPHLLDASYRALLHEPLAPRLVGYMLRAFNENVLYRLFLFPVLAWAAHHVLRRQTISPVLLFAAMVLAQLVNIAANAVLTSADSISTARLAYDGLRYVVPGVIWALLFRRNGFAVAEVASVGCHLFLQPGFTLLL